ncbi:hypothetical protein AGLY_017507 [Aphis glycines]|uniref:Uncharacterized protein n=1 Tax=Aphis glycines TaxID=307491 RepID=A0A6G0SVA9_APHGL|nr:hypothetical protein AGLY_017507 [Aphis glycines]
MIYFHNLHNYQEAEGCFKKCIELKPQRDDLYKKLFAIYQKLKKHINASDICMSLENARKTFTTAVYLNPKNAESHWKIGFTMHKLGQYAIDSVSQLEYFRILYLIDYHNLNNYQEAEHCFKKCIKLKPQREFVQESFYICISLENARKAFTTAMYLNPKNAESHWKIGFAMHNLGQYALALIR